MRPHTVSPIQKSAMTNDLPGRTGEAILLGVIGKRIALGILLAPGCSWREMIGKAQPESLNCVKSRPFGL
jgi:hypothetical protein